MSRLSPRARRRLAGVAGVALGVALGVACGRQAAPRRPGPPLPEAGTPRDDGSGLLATLSMPPAALPAGEAGEAGEGEGEGEGDDTAYVELTAPVAPDPATRFGGYVFTPTTDYLPTPTPYRAGYTAVAVETPGRVTGVVRWPRPPQIASALPGCGGEVANDSLVVDDRGHVEGAVVYLDDIHRGRALLGLASGTTYQRRLQLGGVLERRRCRFEPHVQIAAPIGGVLEISQRSDERSTITAKRLVEGVFAGGVSTELAGAGARQTVPLDVAGPMRVGRDADDDPSHAWVFVAAHPYYVVTDERGRFALDDVPPGTYELVVWHAPVVTLVDGQVTEGAPVTTRQTIVVKPHRATRLSLELP